MFDRLGTRVVGGMTGLGVAIQIGLATDWLEPDVGMPNPLFFSDSVWEALSVLCTLGVAVVAFDAFRRLGSGTKPSTSAEIASGRI